jgi:hypothetical protein
LAAEGIAAELQVVEEIGADAFLFCARLAPARKERVTLRPVGEERRTSSTPSAARASASNSLLLAGGQSLSCSRSQKSGHVHSASSAVQAVSVERAAAVGWAGVSSIRSILGS